MYKHLESNWLFAAYLCFECMWIYIYIYISQRCIVAETFTWRMRLWNSCASTFFSAFMRAHSTNDTKTIHVAMFLEQSSTLLHNWKTRDFQSDSKSFRLFDFRYSFWAHIRWIWRDWILAPKELMRKHPRKLPCHGSCSTLLASVGIRFPEMINSEATSSLEDYLSYILQMFDNASVRMKCCLCFFIWPHTARITSSRIFQVACGGWA